MDLICPWCNKHKLTAWYHWNDEVHLACSEPGDNNCPDTTGKCKTLDEAVEYAKEMIGGKYGGLDRVAM